LRYNRDFEMSIIDFPTGLDLENARVAREIDESDDFSDLVVKFSTDGILVCNAQGEYTLWNPAMERITGIPKEDVLGKRFLERFPLFKGTPVEAAFNEALKGKVVELAPFEFEFPETKARGFAQQKTMPILSEKGDVIGLMIVVRDVTESKKALDALEAENRELKKRLGLEAR